MGLGGGPRAIDDYEWVDLSALRLARPRRGVTADAPVPPAPGADAPGQGRTRTPSANPRRRSARSSAPAKRVVRATMDRPADRLADALCSLLEDTPLWLDRPGAKVLCVDLDNLRAGPVRWRARMAAVVVLARQADHVHLAGQVAAVERARPHLAEFADAAIGVADGSDVADHVLLDAAAADVARLAQSTAGGQAAVQVLVVSNDGIFAELAEHGPLVVLSPSVYALSDRLEDAASDILDLAALEADVVAAPTQP